MAIVGFLVLALTVAIAPTLRVYLHQRSQISSLRSQQQVQEEQVATLQAQAKRWDDPAYVEAQARARLQFVRPGERGYVVSLPAPKAVPPPASGVVAGATGTSGRSWMDSLWTSVRKAGASTSTTSTTTSASG